MTITSTMYSAFFEARMYSGRNKPIGKVLELPDPDIFPATNDEEAIKIAFDRAELLEDLKSLRLSRKESPRKMLIRVREIVRKGVTDKVVLTPKYKGDFKTVA